jgi:hypothetical protein
MRFKRGSEKAWRHHHAAAVLRLCHSRHYKILHGPLPEYLVPTHSHVGCCVRLIYGCLHQKQTGPYTTHTTIYTTHACTCKHARKGSSSVRRQRSRGQRPTPTSVTRKSMTTRFMSSLLMATCDSRCSHCSGGMLRLAGCGAPCVCKKGGAGKVDTWQTRADEWHQASMRRVSQAAVDMAQ